MHEIGTDHINNHLCPGDTGNVLFAGHLCCALSEERGSREKQAAGCGRPCPWNSYQPNPHSGGSGRPVGAPPPASGSSDVPGPRRPTKTEAEGVRPLGQQCGMRNSERGNS